MKYAICMLLLCLVTFNACKKDAGTSDTSTTPQINVVAAKLKGTWVTSASVTYYSATDNDTAISDVILQYDLSFDGQKTLTLIGKVNTTPNFVTTYVLNSNDDTIYFIYIDQAGVNHNMQINAATDTELNFSETITYNPVIPAAGGLFSYNKKMTTYSCVKK